MTAQAVSGRKMIAPAAREDVAPVTNNYYSGEAAKFDSACLAFFMPSGIKGTWQELPHLGGINATS